jgi:hypothetical protein
MVGAGGQTARDRERRWGRDRDEVWEIERVDKRKERKEKIRRKGKQKIKERNRKEKRKEKGIIDILSSYPPYTARRSCFAKRFPKTDSTPQQNPLHQHSHSRSCHSHSRSPAKRTLRRG